MRRLTAATSAAALAVTSFLLPMPAQAAEHTTTYPHTCRAVPSKMQGPQDNQGEAVTINVQGPDTVKLGDTATVKVNVNTGVSILPSLPFGARVTNNSRLKIDLALPDGFELQSALLSADTNITGLTAFTVNEAGEKDPKGRILRLASADNATIANSPNASTSAGGNADYRVVGNKLHWQLPQLTLRLKATELGSGALAVRHAGESSSYGNGKNYMTFMTVVDAGVAGTVWVSTYCTPRASATAPFNEDAKNLFAMRVVETPPKQDTSLKLTTDQVVAGSISPVSVDVSPAEATGTVTFTSGDQTATAPVVGGKATAQLLFATSGSHSVKAVFTPANADEFTSSTTTGTVVAGAKPAQLLVTVPGRVNPGQQFTATAYAVGATGNVTFALAGQSPVTVPLVDGKATATLTAGTEVGNRELVVNYVPDSSSVFAKNSVTRFVNVQETSDTVLALATNTPQVAVGDTVTATATITPRKGTTAVEGVVVFTLGGESHRVPVTNGKASADLTVDTAGNGTISAVFFPATGSDQTIANAETAVIGAAAEETSVVVTPPAELIAGKPATLRVAVSGGNGALGAGTVTANVRGRTTQAPVVDGFADLPVTLTDTATTPVVVSFTPASGSALGAASTTVELTATAGTVSDLNNAVVTWDLPENANADTKIPVTATVAVDGKTEGINGLLSVQANSALLGIGDGPTKVPVVNGKATFTLEFKGGGEQTVQAVFNDATGTEYAGVTGTIKISGGVPPAPSTPAEEGGFMGMIKKFIQMIIAFFQGGSGSSGSS